MKHRNVLLISSDYIKSETNLDSNTSNKYIMSAIKLAQDIELQSTIGTKLLESLQNKIYLREINKDENKAYKELLDVYIQPFLAYQVLSEIIIPISYKMSNFGIMKSDDEKTYASDKSQIDYLRKYYRDKADFFKGRLQDWVIANYSDFEELYTWDGLQDMRQQLYSNSSCSIWLGSIRGKGVNHIDYKNLPNANKKRR